jgi:hypothetical protein
MVVREYLADNFGFDDDLLKTLGKGKQPGANQDAEWGSIEILIFPPGTDVPPNQAAIPAGGSKPEGNPSIQAASESVRKQ